MVRVAYGGEIYAWLPPARPDPPDLQWRPVEGWACDCVGIEHPMSHHAIECPRRYRVRTHVPTYPEHERDRLAAERARRAAKRERDAQGASDVREPVRAWTGRDEELPSALVRLARKTEASGGGFIITRAVGQGRKRVTIGARPAEEGGGDIRQYVPWPLVSVAIRIRGIGWACWTQLQGSDTWKASGAMGCRRGVITRLSPTELGKLIDETPIEERLGNRGKH